MVKKVEVNIKEDDIKVEDEAEAEVTTTVQVKVGIAKVADNPLSKLIEKKVENEMPHVKLSSVTVDGDDYDSAIKSCEKNKITTLYVPFTYQQLLENNELASEYNRLKGVSPDVTVFAPLAQVTDEDIKLLAYDYGVKDLTGPAEEEAEETAATEDADNGTKS